MLSLQQSETQLKLPGKCFGLGTVNCTTLLGQQQNIFG